MLACLILSFLFCLGPLPPSRCRSLFSMATSMIIFSAKAYDIQSLASCAKATLSNKMVDPFLCLVGDSKLQAVNKNSSITFGSKEDDLSASRYLAEITITEDQTRESLVAEIVKNLEKIKAAEICAVREQLLSEFYPDDVCPLGAQMFESPAKVYELNTQTSLCYDEGAPLFTTDDDAAPDNQPKQDSQMTSQVPSLLSVNELLDSLDTAPQPGRFSVSTAPDISYKEMASHCEALLMGKQEKMSRLMTAHKTGPQSKAGNPFADDNLDMEPSSKRQAFKSHPLLCATEFQQQQFMLPASSPYDNFLRAAGC